MKIINILIFIILVLFLNNNNNNNNFVNGDQTLTTKFVPSPECFTNQGCSIFSNSNFWDNQNAFLNPESSNFIINFQNNQTAKLLIYNNFNVNSFTVDFSLSSVSNTIIFNSKFTSNSNIQFSLVSNLILNNATISTSTINIANSVTLLNGNSKITSTSKTSTSQSPDFIVNNLSNLSLYDNSIIVANYLLLQGIVSLLDSSTINVSNTLTSEIGLISTQNTNINCGNALILSGTEKYSLYGTINSNVIDIEASAIVTISNTTTLKLNIKSNSALTTYPFSNVNVIDNISINGNLILGSNSTFTALSDSLQTVGGTVTLNNGTNFNIANLEFPDGSLISNTSQIKGLFSNITVTSGTVKFLGNFNQEERIFGGITVANNASFYAMDQLSLEGCLYVYGYALVNVSVICYNDMMYINESGSVDFLQHSNSYAYLIYNYGIIDIDGSNATIHGNIINYGELNLAVDANLNILGYMDCFETSTIDIQGLGPNTEKPALKVRDILTLNGIFIYNISSPPKDQDSIYLFIQSEIQLDGNFTTYLPSALSDTDLVFSFITPKGYSYPDTLEVIFNYSKPHHIHPILILISILSPLIVIGFLVLVIYKVKQYKQRKGYTPLSSNDKILNDSPQHL